MDRLTDSEMLDWLQARLDEARYTGFCAFRWSSTGRGWRLHETDPSVRSARSDVRLAIVEAIEKEGPALEKRPGARWLPLYREITAALDAVGLDPVLVEARRLVETFGSEDAGSYEAWRALVERAG